MKKSSLLLGHAIAAHTALAQQVYVPAEGPAPRPQCSRSKTKEPHHSYRPFSFTLTETVRYATPVPAPTATTTYAPPPGVVSTLVTPLSYTTWGDWDPNGPVEANDANDTYGRAAWSALWQHANPPSFTETALYSTTVSPTPVPTSELVLPPPDYFGPTDCYNFPAGFSFGVASSAGQIEGAAAREGKSPSSMDILVQDSRAKPYTANEHYYLYKQDIERVAAMGVKYFSFSLAWTRILPFALPGTPVNKQGIDHYNDVINFILEKGMLPVVTLLHFDTPLQFYGSNLTTAADKPEIGYMNGAYQNESFPDAFVHYAKIAMTHYGDRVPIWFTFNEPLLHAQNAKSIDHAIKSHARVYHFYKEELKGTGRVSIKLNNNFGVPRRPNSEADVYAANHFNSIQLGPFWNPIHLGEDYPESFKKTWPDYIPLSKEDLRYIHGTSDFLAISPYTATVVAPPLPEDSNSILECAADPKSTFRPYCVSKSMGNVYGWEIGYRSQSFPYITPTYLRSYLNYVYNTWKAPIVIAEFGFPVYAESQKELPDQLSDSPRSTYYLSCMSEVLKSIWEDGVEVVGAYAWSFADTWEFGSYDPQFGLQVVNRTTQTRRFKKSFFDLVDFMRARGA
ncbi:glycoside hydrolase [Metarhizium album ARSEF 1941]|uniref:Glycoside hydrolase n=1 Tax=Metarhizium album (strain ARSEF 1941) TaxID=1081103 RepID=A0A0B2WZX6_METAS|nr:glycoside hydrolase [Metarhizium album ARSEF 1941]KHN99139.1 glycoside hydrolase [Metarhizium album ARSEF 1941]